MKKYDIELFGLGSKYYKIENFDLLINIHYCANIFFHLMTWLNSFLFIPSVSTLEETDGMHKNEFNHRGSSEKTQSLFSLLLGTFTMILFSELFVRIANFSLIFAEFL